MRKHCSNVCKLRPCLATESTNSAPMCTTVTAAAIFANGTYFLVNPCKYQPKGLHAIRLQKLHVSEMVEPFKCRVKSRLPFAGIISPPYTPALAG
jgi:hypothetical protein